MVFSVEGAKILYMEQHENKNTLYLKLSTVLLGALAIAAIVTLCIPSTRTVLRSYILNPARKVLSIANGNLLHNGSFVKVVKYKTPEGILIEVLSSDDSGSRSLIDRISIYGEHDGFFDFYGEASQLAIMDVDEDGKMELVAPTFDNNLVAHLNIYKYNDITKKFEPLQP